MIDADHRPDPGAVDDRAAAREGLMAAPFEFTEIQADAHPRHARSASSPAWRASSSRRSWTELRATIAELEAILADEGRMRHRHQGGVLAEIKREFATPRRAEITYDPGEITTSRTSSTTRSSSSR